MYYTIIPKCKTNQSKQLALSVDVNGTATVELHDQDDPNQQWLALVNFSAFGVLLIHVATGKALAVEQVNSSNLNLHEVKGPGDILDTCLWQFDLTDDHFAIESQCSSENYLNVKGNGPYNVGDEVIGYEGWGGGDDNEVWSMNLISLDVPYTWFHSIISQQVSQKGKDLALSLPPTDDSGNIIVFETNQNLPQQLWTPVFYANEIDNKVVWGIAFINKKSGRALMAAGGSSAMVFTTSVANLSKTSQMNYLTEHAVWTTGSDETAFRPFYTSSANLNMSGNGPYNSYNKVIAYNGWNRNKNEKWDVLFYEGDANSEDIIVSADGYDFCVLESSNEVQECSIDVQKGASDLSFNFANLDSTKGVGFTVTSPNNKTYSLRSSGKSGYWAVESSTQNQLKAFYFENPIAGTWKAKVTSKNQAKWTLVGCVNSPDSVQNAKSRFLNLSRGEQQALINSLKPSLAYEELPAEFCFYCLAQGYAIAGLLLITFVFWAGPVTATSSVVLYIERLIGANASSVAKHVNSLYGIYKVNNNLNSLIKELCKLEGFCK